MKKRIIALLLVFVMVITTTTAFASESSDKSDNSVTFIDDLGNEYRLSSFKDGNQITAIQTTMDGELVAKSVLDCSTGEIENTVSTSLQVAAATSEIHTDTFNGFTTFTTNINDYIVDENNLSTTRSKSFDSSFYDSSYIYKGTGKTDFLYKGKILEGKYYYRATGYYTEQNRVSCKFVRGALITAITTVLTKVLTGNGLITAAVLAKSLLSDYGISIAQDCIQGDFSPVVSIRSYDVKYKATMKPSSTYVDMCVIDRVIDYVYSNLDGKINREYVDMISYTTSDEAIWGGCSEALGYAAYAFEAKYITQNRPNLKLPVSGNQWTWVDN